MTSVIAKIRIKVPNEIGLQNLEEHLQDCIGPSELISWYVNYKQDNKQE